MERSCSAATSSAFSFSACSFVISSCSADEALVHLAQVRVLLVRRLADGAHGELLEGGQRVGLVGGGELLEHPLARLVEQLGDRRAHLVLDRGRRLRAEVALQDLGDVPLVGPEGLLEARAQLGDDLLGRRAQPLLDLARGLLEVRAQDLHGGAGLLAVQDPGADLDRVGDHALGILARLGAHAHELGGDGIVDDEVLDDHAPDEGADAGPAEWGGGLHGRPNIGLAPGRRTPRAPPAPPRSRRGARQTSCPGPTRENSTSAETASSSPSNTASTVPSEQLRTQPATPRRSASWRTESRKKTPCTSPEARILRRMATPVR